jgi:hypothetical protein
MFLLVREGEKPYREHTLSLTCKTMSWNKLEILLLLLENNPFLGEWESVYIDSFPNA